VDLVHVYGLVATCSYGQF